MESLKWVQLYQLKNAKYFLQRNKSKSWIFDINLLSERDKRIYLYLITSYRCALIFHLNRCFDTLFQNMSHFFILVLQFIKKSWNIFIRSQKHIFWNEKDNDTNKHIFFSENCLKIYKIFFKPSHPHYYLGDYILRPAWWKCYFDF